MSSSHFTFHFKAPRTKVFQALIDPELIKKWRFPEGMAIQIHHFESHQGGKFRVTLTYDDVSQEGKSGQNKDTYHGYFKRIIPNELVEEVIQFETEDAGMKSEMIITTSLKDMNGGTELIATHQNLPKGLNPKDNEEGWMMSLRKLASLLEKS